MVISFTRFRPTDALQPAVKHYRLMKGERECRKEIWEFMSKSVTHFKSSREIDECKHEGVSEAYLDFIHNVMSFKQQYLL